MQQSSNVAPKEVIKLILMVRKMQKAGDPKFSEYHERIYSDGVWNIDLEVHPYGNIRFWVSREDKYGNYLNSLFTMYRADNGDIRWMANYKIKKSIVERMLRIFELMEKANLTD